MLRSMIYFKSMFVLGVRLTFLIFVNEYPIVPAAFEKSFFKLGYLGTLVENQLTLYC